MDAKSRRCEFSIKKAHDAQLRLSKRIIFDDKLPRRIKYVAGVDVAYSDDFSIGAVVVLDYATLECVEIQTALCKTLFPYIPTLLSFREIPPATMSIKKLRIQPDVFLVDGHGFAHPYRCGFASHLGLIIGKPSIGVAKSRLLRDTVDVEAEKDVTFLRHKGEIVGARIITKQECQPVYVSVGHMVSLETAIRIVKHCTCNSRIPKPILEAHKMANDKNAQSPVLRSS
ncbi:MAG TPA: endonuclease V [Candidatus Bathyarchaeia archaeon]